MKKQNVQIVTSQRRRRLVSQKFRENTTMSFDLPVGEVVKSAYIYLKGYYTPVFAAGAPIGNLKGVASALIKSVKIETDGGKVHKVVNPDWMRRQAQYLSGQDSQPLYKANSTVLGDTPTTGFAQIGTTAQSVAFSESFEIPFENRLSTDWAKTFLNLRGKTSSVVQIETAGLLSVADLSGDALDSCTGDIDIDIVLETVPHFVNQNFLTFRQYEKEISLSGQATNTPFELPRGGAIQGMWIVCEQGAAQQRINYDDAAKIRFQLVKNGTENLADVRLLDLIEINDAKSPIINKIKGAGYLNLLVNKSFATALRTGAGSDVNALDLVVTSDAGFTYTPAFKIKLQIDEIVNLND